MNDELIKRFMAVARKHSPLCYISTDNEMVVEPKNNIYFRMNDIKSELDFKCKVIAWLSRPACKGVSEYRQKKIRAIMNEFLGADFSAKDMEEVYTWMGNDCDRSLTIKFIGCNYDMSLLSYHAYMKKRRGNEIC